jgi:hypothetical protein
MEVQCVFCVLGIEFLNIIQISFMLQTVKSDINVKLLKIWCSSVQVRKRWQYLLALQTAQIYK